MVFGLVVNVNLSRFSGIVLIMLMFDIHLHKRECDPKMAAGILANGFCFLG